MLLSVLSVVALATTVVWGAPQSGYGYPASNRVSILNSAETQSSQQIVFPDTQEFEDQFSQGILQESADEESVVTTDDHHEGDHDHQHHDHHLGLEWLREAVPGEPGVDYPIYWQVPRTSFNCRSLPAPGYYADIEAGCQVFHVCNEQGDKSFLCPNGTVFNQEHFTCQWWFNVDCGNSQQFYGLNINSGAVAEETQGTVIFKGEDQVEQREQEFPLEPFEIEQEVPRVEEGQESVQQRNKYDGDEVLSTSLENEQQTVSPLDSENKEISGQESDQQPTKTQLLYDQETVPVQDASVPSVQGNAENVLEQGGSVLDNAVQEDDFIENETEAANIHHTTEHTPAEQKADDVPSHEVVSTPVQETIIEVLASLENNLTQKTDGQVTAYNPALDETDKNSVQQEDNFIISEEDSLAAPVPQDTNYILDPQQTSDVPVHQDAYDAHTQLDKETVYATQEEIEITTVPSVYSLIEQGTEDGRASQETVSLESDNESVQSQKDHTSVEDATDYTVPQKTDSVAPQETDHTLIQQEHDGDQTQQEVIYTSDSKEDEDSPVHQPYDHSTFSQDAAFTPNQHQADLSPVQQNFDNSLNQQEISEAPLQQESGYAFVHPDSETDYVHLNHGTNYNPVQHETLNTNGQQETGNTTEEQDFTINSAQDVTDFTPSQQDTDYSPGQKEADNSSLQHQTDYTSILEDTDYIPVQQEESYTPLQQETGNTLVKQQNDHSLLQEEDSFSSVQEEFKKTSVQEVTDYTPLPQEVGYTSVYQEINPNTAHQEPVYTPVPQENDYTLVQEKTGYVPVHQETDHTSVQQKPEHTFVQQDTDTLNQEVTDHPSPLQVTVSDITQQEPDYAVNQQVTEEQQNGHVVLVDQDTTMISDQQHDSQGVILQETFFDTVQDENDLVAGQQEITDISVQQQPENAFGQKNYNADRPNHQEVVVNLSEEEITSLDQHTPEHFTLQQENAFSNFLQDPSNIPIPEPGLVDLSSQEPAYSPVQESDFSSVPQEPFSSVQQESDYYPGLVVPEISAVKPEQETQDLPESFPEVIPEAESAFDVPSATVPEVSLLYGVPVAHTTNQVLDATTEALLLPEYDAVTTGKNEFIAPGVLLIDSEHSVTAETSPVSSDFIINRDLQEEQGTTEYLGQGVPQTQNTAFDELQERFDQNQPTNENTEFFSEQTEAETELPVNSHLFLIPENSVPFGSGLTVMVEDDTADVNDYELAFDNQIRNNVQVADLPLVQTDEENITEIPLSTENINTQDLFKDEAFDTLFSNIADEQLTETESPELFITEVPIDIAQELTTGSLFNFPDFRNHHVKSNETKIENLRDDEEVSLVTETRENQISSLEIQVNNDVSESDDIITIAPIVRVFPKGHEDPVLSLFFKGESVELSDNKETITELPREEFSTAYDSKEESTDFVTDEQNQLVLKTEDATVVPGIKEYATIPSLLREKVNEVYAPDSEEENEQVGISQVTDSEAQFTPLPHGNIERNTETHTILQTQEVPYSSFQNTEETNAQPHTPYGASKQPIDHFPHLSGSYLPPRVA